MLLTAWNTRRRTSTYDPGVERHAINDSATHLSCETNTKSPLAHCTSDKCTFATSPICRVFRLRTVTPKLSRNSNGYKSSKLFRTCKCGLERNATQTRWHECVPIVALFYVPRPWFFSTCTGSGALRCAWCQTPCPPETPNLLSHIYRIYWYCHWDCVCRECCS